MRSILRITFLLFATLGFAQVGGESLYTFLNLASSPRQVALGGVTLTSEDDVSQVIWNPSIASEKISNHVGVNYVNFIADIQVGSASYAKTIIDPKYGTAFLTVQYQDYGSLTRTDASGPTSLGTFGAQDVAIGLGYSYTLEDISIGASLKYINSSIDTFTSSAFLYDVGFTYRSPNNAVVFSVVSRNNGKQLTAFRNTKERISNVVIVAFSYQLEHVPLKIYGTLDEVNNWNLGQPNPSNETQNLEGEIKEEEVSSINNAFRHLSGGAELWSDKKFNIRIGYNIRRAQEFKLKEVKTNAGLSYGFGIKYKSLAFDYAFSKFQPEAAYHSFGLVVKL